MEGNGPGSGDPVAMNLILMSTDPVALDSVFARLVYLKPEMVPTNYHGEKMGLGNCREENIEVVVVEENPSASAVQYYKFYAVPTPLPQHWVCNHVLL